MGKDLKGKEIGTGIRQNKNGRYEARYVDRYGNRKSIYASSKTEIKNKLAQAIKEDKEQKNVAKRLTVAQWYSDWMTTYKIPVIRPNTRLHYESIFNKQILPELGSMWLEDVRQIHVKALINKLDKEGYQWETQNKTRILLSDMFNAAIENDYAVRNPTKGVKLGKNKPKDVRITLTSEQQQDFFECSSGTFYHSLYLVAVNTGLRPGEVCALTEKDLNFDENTISVTKTLIYQKFDGDDGKLFHIGEPKTSSSVRKVPMNSICRDALLKQIRLKKLLSLKYKKEDEFADLLFVTKFNTPISSQILNESICRIINEINLQRDDFELFPRFSAHTFRHTFATRCIEAGIQPKTLQKYLGHSSLQMTMDLYVHVTEDFKQSEIKKLEDSMPAKHQKIVSIEEFLAV